MTCHFLFMVRAMWGEIREEEVGEKIQKGPRRMSRPPHAQVYSHQNLPRANPTHSSPSPMVHSPPSMPQSQGGGDLDGGVLYHTTSLPMSLYSNEHMGKGGGGQGADWC